MMVTFECHLWQGKYLFDAMEKSLKVEKAVVIGPLGSSAGFTERESESGRNKRVTKGLGNDWPFT